MFSDSHKGITKIQYNSLNLPYELLIKNTEVSGKVYYTYSASGVKLKTKHLKVQNLGYTPVTDTTGDTNLDVIKITDYIGSKVYEDGALKRILVDGGYIEGNTYHYYVTDHLGNNRMVIKQDGTIIQRSHYYPFGATFADGTGLKEQPYKYNSKELDQMHGLNLYDYSARYYEPAIGRFTSVDPHAENYYSWSPYAYVMNNPMKYVDPDGRDIWIYYEDEDGNEQKILYTANMKYEGKNEFIIKSISYLNAINDNGGNKMLNELIGSSNSFNIQNKIPTDSKGNLIEGAMQFDEFVNGGGNIYAGAIMNPNHSEYSSVESISHELFHGLQHEKGQGGASIFNKVEANVYSGIIASNWAYNTGYMGGLSSNGLGTPSFAGVFYESAFSNLLEAFSEISFVGAVQNFKVGSAKNTSRLYNGYPLVRDSQKSSILKKYYPQ